MKFLIQTVKGKIVHDFSFTLLKSVEYNTWLNNGKTIGVKYLNTQIDDNGNAVCSFEFKPFHKDYVPVGSVEFVSAFLQHFYNHTPKPINVPEEIQFYAHREIFNVNHMDLENYEGKWFVKSSEKIKGFAKLIDFNYGSPQIPAGHYQVSEEIQIESEWRAFVYNGKLVGLQNYCGEFWMFPDVRLMKTIIESYKSAPIAYTLDVGISRKYGNDTATFIVEVHDFFSCGLYGFADHRIYPQMLHRWFNEYKIKNNLK